MKKLLIIVLIILSFFVGRYIGTYHTESTRVLESYVRLMEDVDFERDNLAGVPKTEIQGLIKSGSVGMLMYDPQVKTSNKTIYFPVVIPYEKKGYYETLDRSVR